MKIKDKIDQLEVEMAKYKTLLEKYPDLEEYKGRWKTYLCAKSANIKCTIVEFGKTCGCCGDAPLKMELKTEDDVYSYPPSVTILSCDYSGEVLEPEDWNSLMITVEKVGLSQEMTEKIFNLLKKKVEAANKRRELRSQIDDLKD